MENTTITIDKELGALIRISAAEARVTIKEYVAIMYETTIKAGGAK